MKLLTRFSQSTKPLFSLASWLTVMVLVAWWSYSAQSWARNLRQESAKEYQIKAVYLYNFSSFITWKPEAFANPQAPFTYCVLGTNPFDKQLDLTIANEQVEGHPIQTKYLTQVEQADGCHVLFIASSEVTKLQPILAQLQKRPILTVSDIPDFVEQGGMIKFYTNQRRQVRMMVDPLTLQEVGLAVSGNLLRVAEVVRR